MPPATRFMQTLIAVPTVLLMGSGVARANSENDSVTGLITGLTAKALQVQTPSGGVSVGLFSKTPVTRQVSGSLADVRPNVIIDAHLQQGNGRIDSIRIHAGDRAFVRHTRRNAHLAAVQAPAGKGSRHHHTAITTGHLSGVVTSVEGPTVTVRDERGNSTTYTFASSVSVTKVMSGSVDDLAIGETVHVDLLRGNQAADVVILRA